MAGRTLKARVFESHRCTTSVHNALFDTIMPKVSGNAWKLLCLVIRQTDGWNRDEIGLSYRDLLQGLGVSSRATVAAAIEELRPFNLLTIVEPGRWEESRYSLNLDAEIDWQPMDFGKSSVTENGTAPVTKTVTASVTKNGAAPVTESVLINRKEINNLNQERERDERTESASKPKLALVSSVGENPHLADQPFSPNDDFSQPAPKQEWSIAERFVLKACSLWDDLADQEKPVVETNWKTKQAVQSAGKYVAARLNVKQRIGGTPKMFLEFWHDTLKRSIAPRPEYVVEQWEAYDRWLVENYETHRRIAA